MIMCLVVATSDSILGKFSVTRYPSLTSTTMIRRLEDGLKMSKGQAKLKNILNTSNVKSYIGNFCHQNYALPLTLPKKQDTTNFNSILVNMNEPNNKAALTLIDHTTNHIGMNNYNPYTKERVVTVNKSIDLRDQHSFELDNTQKDSKKLKKEPTKDDSLLKSKKNISYLSLPKILGFKSKLKSQEL